MVLIKNQGGHGFRVFMDAERRWLKRGNLFSGYGSGRSVKVKGTRWSIVSQVVYTNLVGGPAGLAGLGAAAAGKPGSTKPRIFIFAICC